MNVVRHKITTAGQVSIPADVRRRWDTDSVVIEDYGDHLVVRPRPSDSVEAARGALKGKGRDISADEMIRIMDEDERRAQARKERLWSSWMRTR
jgi:bifunctional DNA-binding transcriptional regulator/antitoxin component of YhaV-PrlF toxin-antitoxin module